jgi:hypothetical protein
MLPANVKTRQFFQAYHVLGPLSSAIYRRKPAFRLTGADPLPGRGPRSGSILKRGPSECLLSERPKGHRWPGVDYIGAGSSLPE